MQLENILCSSLAVTFAAFAGCQKPHAVHSPEAVTRPETGYPFPEASAVTGIRVTECFFLPEREVSFDVPSGSRDAILESLLPSQADHRPVTVTWPELASLEIRTEDGECHHVDVYDFDDRPVGEFSASSSRNPRAYYQGGRPKLFREAIERAYAEHQSEQ